HVARVPHGVDLPSRLDDVAAGAQDHLLVLRAEADLALEDDRYLVLARVDVGPHERADGERMLDHRYPAGGVLAVDLEVDADSRAKPPDAALPRWHDLEQRGGGRVDGHVHRSVGYLSEQGCILNR